MLSEVIHVFFYHQRNKARQQSGRVRPATVRLGGESASLLLLLGGV